jgi:DNA-binding response OmpR family regulator
LATVLVVDDERLLVKGLKRSLEQEGFTVLEAFDGEQGLALFRDRSPELVVLDLMLPVMDGLTVCREIRRHSDTPIIMLTARGEDVDKIVGLELGADDYVTKPFNTRELVARIRAVLRRFQAHPAQPEEGMIRAGRLEIDGLRRKVAVAGEQVDLTAREFDLRGSARNNCSMSLTASTGWTRPAPGPPGWPGTFYRAPIGQAARG